MPHVYGTKDLLRLDSAIRTLDSRIDALVVTLDMTSNEDRNLERLSTRLFALQEYRHALQEDRAMMVGQLQKERLPKQS